MSDPGPGASATAVARRKRKREEAQAWELGALRRLLLSEGAAREEQSSGEPQPPRGYAQELERELAAQQMAMMTTMRREPAAAAPARADVAPAGAGKRRRARPHVRIKALDGRLLTIEFDEAELGPDGAIRVADVLARLEEATHMPREALCLVLQNRTVSQSPDLVLAPGVTLHAIQHWGDSASRSAFRQPAMF